MTTRRFPSFSTWVGFVLGAAGLLWLGAGESLSANYRPTVREVDYYNLLVDGFLEGNTWMKVEMDPRLARGEPDAIRKGASYLLDASVYEGRYYLYFGAFPAVTLLLPFRVLTGADLPDNTAAAILIIGGFALQAAAYSAARRRYFPAVGGFGNAALILLLAFGAGTPFLLTFGGFYELAIAGGYLCVSALWWALMHAHLSPRDSVRWIALASLAGGLAVGSRPNLILALPIVLIAALLQRRGLRLVLAAVLPAALVGAVLMAYNAARFGNPLEFGHTYQLNGLGDRPLAHASFIWANLKWYLLTPPTFTPYYPFIYPIDASVRPANYYGHELITGHWMSSILGAALAAAGLLLARRLEPGKRALARWLLLPSLFAFLMIGCLAVLGIRSNRYAVDFAGTLVLVLALGAGLVLSVAFGTWKRRIAGWSLGLAAVLVGLVNALGALQLAANYHIAGPPGIKAVEYAANHFSHALHRLGLLHYGPVRMRVRLDPSDVPEHRRVLLATGTTEFGDLVAVTQNPGDVARFSIEHKGYGGLISENVAWAPGSRHELEVDLGSLYPPRNHPYFRGWPASEVDKLRTVGRIALDGAEILRGRVDFYPHMAHRLAVGRGPLPGGPPLDGEITAFERLPARDVAATPWLSETGVWRLRVRFPYHLPNMVHPLLGSGTTGAGNLLQLRVFEDRRLQLGFDRWGGGLVPGPFIPASAEPEHVLEIFVGARVADAAARLPSPPPAAVLEANRGTMRVWLDGREVWTVPVDIHQGTYDFVSVGSNPQGFSQSIAFYGGEMKRIELSPAEVREIIDRNLALPPARSP